MKREKIITFLNKVGRYLFMLLLIAASFFSGIFFNQMDIEETECNISKLVKRSDINIAIDEGNNLIIFDNLTGEYIIYQDSIGRSIFNIYAKNMIK